ncbi:hypothetical protein D3C86_2008670 [compost metagenome]
MIIASTPWPIKLSTCSTCFNAERSASTVISSTPISFAFASIASLTFTINSFCMLNIVAPITSFFPPSDPVSLSDD